MGFLKAIFTIILLLIVLLIAGAVVYLAWQHRDDTYNQEHSQSRRPSYDELQDAYNRGRHDQQQAGRSSASRGRHNVDKLR